MRIADANIIKSQFSFAKMRIAELSCLQLFFINIENGKTILNKRFCKFF